MDERLREALADGVNHPFLRDAGVVWSGGTTVTAGDLGGVITALAPLVAASWAELAMVRIGTLAMEAFVAPLRDAGLMSDHRYQNPDRLLGIPIVVDESIPWAWVAVFGRLVNPEPTSFGPGRAPSPVAST